MGKYDLVVKNGSLVIPRVGIIRADIGILNGKIVSIDSRIEVSQRAETVDASGMYVFPGAIDSHAHIGIFRPLSEDAITESISAACGGVTTVCSYFRTGKHYFNKSGRYSDIFPEILEKSSGSYHVDYAYHLAVMDYQQLEEVEMLVKHFGVSTFKYYMFYKMLDLTGAPATSQYLMTDSPYDLGFLYEYMKEVARISKMFESYGRVSLSVHCEQAEIINVATRHAKQNPSGNVLKDYSNARPPFSEKLAIKEVEVLACETGCPVNLLHLSSIDALEAAEGVTEKHGKDKVLLEVTLHHLGLSYDIPYGKLAKVNPPIRDRKHVEGLWDALIRNKIDTVVSDSACATQEIKQGDIWTSLAGFGGIELMFPLLITEGYYKRGLRLERIAELLSYNPALYHGLYPKKGTIAIGADADLAIVDLHKEKEVRVETLHSAQDFTPFEGLKYSGWPVCTILRGKVIFENGQILGTPEDGKYVKRPVAYHYVNEIAAYSG
ncbi:MAG: dihydroorotase family protein [Candidatus Bathyarchaeia archaeon]